MTRFRTLAIISIATLTLVACSTSGMDVDSTEGVFLIEHSGPGTVYWE